MKKFDYNEVGKQIGWNFSNMNYTLEKEKAMKKFEDLTFADHYMFEKVLQNKEIFFYFIKKFIY